MTTQHYRNSAQRTHLSPQAAVLACMAERLAVQPDIGAAYLFGSLARGQERIESDVDVGILFLDKQSEYDRTVRRLELTALLEECTSRSVQVIDLTAAPPLLAYQVVKDGALLTERAPYVRIAFEVRSMKRYFDIQPMLRHQYAAQERRLKEGRYGQRRRSPHALDAARRLLERVENTPDD